MLGYVAAHSITDTFYILRNYPLNERREILTEICSILTVIGIDKNKLITALNNLDFDDIEDCLQFVCSEECKADFIITRNEKDFSSSKVPPINPAEFLSKINYEGHSVKL